MKTPAITEAMTSAENSANFTGGDLIRKESNSTELVASTLETMKKAKRWLLHKNKRPFYANGGARHGELDSPLDLSQLVDYARAKIELQKRPTMSGLGFALGGGWQGIDFDKINDKNRHLLELVEDLPGYVERSPSGNGVHAIGMGQPIDAIKGEGIEVYSQKRYFTFTGDVIRDAPVTDLARFVYERLKPIAKRQATPQSPVHIVKKTIDSFEWLRVKDALKWVSADCDHDTWLQVMMALHSTHNAEAFDVFVDWSHTAPHRVPSSEVFIQRWRSLHSDRLKGISIATLFMLARANGWSESKIDIRQALSTLTAAHTSSPITNELRYKLISPTDVLALGSIKWRIKGLIPERGIAAIYGPSGSGKSFLVLDMLASIARGDTWFGYRVEPCPVLYVCLEGEAGFPKRIHAYTNAKSAISNRFKYLAQGVSLKSPEDLGDLLTSIKAHQMDRGIVVLDTLNRAVPGMDENSSIDMGMAIDACKAIEQETCGLVLLVHHAGKDATKGMRGHSSLLAALDAAIEVIRSGDMREWSVVKAKDGEDGKAHPFMLEVVDMGEDEDGDPITSCVIRPSASAGLKARPLSRAQQFGMDTFSAAAVGTDECSLEPWRKEFYRRSTCDTQSSKQKAFARVRRELVEIGKLSVKDDIYRLASSLHGLAANLEGIPLGSTSPPGQAGHVRGCPA